MVRSEKSEVRSGKRQGGRSVRSGLQSVGLSFVRPLPGPWMWQQRYKVAYFLAVTFRIVSHAPIQLPLALGGRNSPD